MPELPEVEVTRRRLAPILVGRVIERVETTKDSYFFLTKPEALKRRLAGRSVRELKRDGAADIASGTRNDRHFTGELFFTHEAFSTRHA